MNSVKKFLKGFTYAFSGLLFCIRSCKNFRFHLVAAAFVLYFSKHFDFDLSTYLALFILFAMVLSAEAFNTALEQVCDSITDKPLESIKHAKDAAAAAVLITAVFATVIAIILFLKDFKIIYVLIDYVTNPLKCIALLAALALSFIFVFCEGLYKNGK